MSVNAEKILLRQQLLAKRRQLTPIQIALTSERVCQQIAVLSEFQAANQIAYYYPIRGEIDPRFLFNQFSSKKWHLPICQSDNSLLFAPVEIDAPLTQTTLGVWEPATTKPLINVANLDCILLPIVGFNLDNYRLGYGKGYYDKTLSGFKKNEKRPYLIGLAYDWQQCDHLPVDEWDIQLDLIVTA